MVKLSVPRWLLVTAVGAMTLALTAGLSGCSTPDAGGALVGPTDAAGLPLSHKVAKDWQRDAKQLGRLGF